MRSEPRVFAGAKPSKSPSARIAVFTSLDGTLLDCQTFDAGPARDVVRELHAAGVPIVPVTVMTLDEVEPLARDLGFVHPMIIEAGSAVARLDGGEWVVEPFGPPADAVLEAVRAIEEISGAQLAVYSVQPEQIASLVSGRTGEMLRASVNRVYSEPFLIESGSMAAVEKAARTLGFVLRKGGRFLYLCREDAEIEAFRAVREELQCELVIGVGGATIDAAFLERSDVPIIIPRSDGRADAELMRLVPRAIVASAAGCAGWATCVSEAWHTVSKPAN